MNQSTTAAQPLDLDKSRAEFEMWARANCGMTDESLGKRESGHYAWGRTCDMWESWQHALIAQARASQPEGATGTIKAIQTAEEASEAFFAQERTIHRLEDEIAGLRAQLARFKSWYDAVTDECVVSGELPWDENDAKGSLAKLIAWNEEIALDPEVSVRAAALAQQSPAPVAALDAPEAAHAQQEAAAPDCKVEFFSSRVCEHGTRSCTVKHYASPSDAKDAAPTTVPDHSERGAANANDAEAGFYKRLSQQARDDAKRERVRDAVAEALDGLYTCGRVWSAWGYGTMSQDDFAPASEDDDVVDSITDAAIAAMAAVGAQEPGTPQVDSSVNPPPEKGGTQK